MITLNAIEQRLREFADNHFFLKSYSFGSPDDVDLDKFQDFPLMHVVYTGSDYDERTKTYGFELYVFDRPNREENMTDHQREVVSDAEQCLEDIVADIANGGNIFLFTEDYEVTAATVTPLVDERSNLLSGALLDLSIQVPYQRDACNLPIDGVSPEGGVITYQRRGILRVREQDGTPDVQSVNEIRVTNGTLTDEGNGVVSIDTGGVDTLGDLTNVTIDDPQDREALVYDQDTDTWINGASTKLAIRVINQTGNTLLAGTPVKASGVQGDQVKVTVYQATQDPKLYIGMLDSDIPNGGTGYARQTGAIYNLNTAHLNVGDILYVNELSLVGDNGLFYLSTTMPTGTFGTPVAKIPTAIVLRKHENTGRVYVRTWTPDSTLDELANVSASNKSAGDVLVWNGSVWTAGATLAPSMYELRDVFDYSVGTLQGGSILVWDATNGYWFPQPKLSFLPGASAYYLGQYDIDAGNGRTAASTASVTVERYLTIQGDGEGESISAQSDTPSSGNKIVRKIWYKANSFEQSDVDTWTLIHTFADDTAYSATEATFEALLNAQTYGTPPFTLAQSWEDIPAFTGLLDTYPGAAAAYSLRLLDADYSGSAINVRRASDNAVQDIGFDANGDLDTSALATFCAGTDGFVVRWYDQSGNTNDAVQTTTTNQPKIYDSATGVVTKGSAGNEKPALFFSSDYLTVPNSTSTFNSLHDGTLSSVFLVFSAGIAPDPNNIYGIAGNSGNATLNTGVMIAYDDRAGILTPREDALFCMITKGVPAARVARVSTDFAITPQNQTLLSLFLDADDTSIGDRILYAFDGGAEVGGNIDTNSPNTSDASFDFQVGAVGNSSSAFTGTIQSLIIYPSDQSANRTAIETNINDYYTIY